MQILDLIKPYFIGKTLKYLVSHKHITQDYLLRKKKSHSVTDKQFESGIQKYSQFVTRKKIIGKHLIFESAKILDVIVKTYEDYDSSYTYLEFVLSNDMEYQIELCDEFIEIDKNTIMIKQQTSI